MSESGSEDESLEIDLTGSSSEDEESISASSNSESEDSETEEEDNGSKQAKQQIATHQTGSAREQRGPFKPTAHESEPEDESEENEEPELSSDAEKSEQRSHVEDDIAGAPDESTEEDDRLGAPDEAAARREANIRALVQGDLQVCRKPMLPKLLTVKDAELVLRKPFKSPHPSAPARTGALKRALAARKIFVPWGSGKPFQPVKVTLPGQEEGYDQDPSVEPPAPPVELPPGVEPLVLWEPPDGTTGEPVRVDDALTRFLRPHQREGVQFMFECVTGLRNFEGQGCILADDMGLGKTLQGITLLWTLLNNGHELLGGTPLARRIIICCPTSLVSNWDSECSKWLNGRVRTLPLCESSRDDVIATINQFLSPKCPAQLLIVSYETFRLHAERFLAPESCDLLICDEAHRLKNDQTLTNRALASLACRRRVLLSGTPMQNQLQEFYSMVNFCNPGVLGTPAQFRKQYEAPILAGREPDASDTDRERGAERSSELSTIVNEFILRRTNNLLSAHLPPKVVEVVCCRMTPLQYELYCHFVQSRSVRSLFASQKSARVLSAITSLRKLLNHPKLIYDMVQSSSAARSSDPAANGFAGAGEIFPPGIFDAGRGNRGSLPPGWENLSGKFAVVSRMLALLREQTKDRVVIVSNYTQTLDLFTSLCRERGYPCLRLDGSTSISKRQKLVKIFNDPADNQFVFLLSSKAGGCGLNLVGGNRLILFDMSWNPADDKQAAARVWRDGQRRRVYVYRFMTTGTIEEKVYQRQLSKEGLQAVVDTKSDSGASSALMSVEELRDLFSYDPDTLSTTYDHMVAGSGRRKAGKVLSEGHDIGSDDEDQDLRLQEEHPSAAAESLPPKSAELAALGPILSPQNGKPKEEDLAAWGHHSEATTVPDEVMKLAGGEDVTFVFSCQVDGREVPEDPPLVPLGQGKAVAAVGKEGDTAGPATKSLARRTVPSGNAGSTRPAFKAPSFNAPAVVAAAVASASVKPSSQRVEKAPLQGQGSSQQRVQPKMSTAAATAVPKEVAAPRCSRPSQNAKTVPDDGGGACCALVAEERTGVLTATAVPGPGQTQHKPPPMPKIAVTAPVVQRKSTAGVKRRSNGAPSCGGSAPSGTQKKRVTITYDSDDDFK